MLFADILRVNEGSPASAETVGIVFVYRCTILHYTPGCP